MRDRVEEIINEFEILTGERDRLAIELEALDIKEHQLRDFQKKLDEKERALLAEKQAVSKEKQFLSRFNQELVVKKDSFATKEKLIAEATAQIDKRNQEAEAERADINQQITRLTALMGQKDHLDQDKKFLERERIIDRERKLQLDEKEAFLEAEKKRLNDIAVRMKV